MDHRKDMSIQSLDEAEAVLNDEWLGTDEAVAIADEASVSAGRAAIRAC